MRSRARNGVKNWYRYEAEAAVKNRQCCLAVIRAGEARNGNDQTRDWIQSS